MQNYQGNRHGTTGSHAGAIGHLARLDETRGLRVADDEPDVHGWPVITADGLAAGHVDGLIVDTDAMKVRYLDVALDRDALRLNENRHVLIPIGGARLDERKDDVLLDTTAADLAKLQPYEPGGEISAAASPAANRARPEDDPGKFYGARGGSGGVQRVTLSEEELQVRKQQREAGSVAVGKTVETEHVSKRVPVMHEEVTVERRPISADSPSAGTGKISGDEVARVPLMSEEATIDKRVVPKEEVVIRKKQVQGEQRVEADLRKERLDVEDSTAGKKRR